MPESDRKPIDRAALRALLAKATSGPWRAGRMVHADRDDNLTAEELGEYVKNSVIKSEGESRSQDFLVVLAAKSDGPADVCLVGNGPTSPANATLIAASVHVLHALLDMLDEAEAALEACTTARRTDVDRISTYLGCGVCRLDVQACDNHATCGGARARAALARIRGGW